MQYWSALDIINQVAGELGLSKAVTLFAPDDTQSVQNSQMLAALTSAGAELGLIYPWQQFRKPWAIQLVAGQDRYPLPDDWEYFLDQTQWDNTNHWAMSGPRSAAEWAYLKGGIVASAPRMRYRVMDDNFCVFPMPGSTSQFDLTMEYVSGWWVSGAGTQEASADRIIADGDVVMYNPWLAIRFTKLKWLQLKNFDTTSASADFQRVYDSLRGKDVGAPVLSLVNAYTPVFIGPHSVPDGSWNV